MAKVARMYYMQDLNQRAITEKLQLHRSTISRMLNFVERCTRSRMFTMKLSSLLFRLFTAALAGFALSRGGIALAVMMPVAGLLARKFDPRVIISIGFVLTAAGLFTSRVFTTASISVRSSGFESFRSSVSR
jgi:hypothetical protein